MEGGRDGGMGEKRRRKYIFMFAGMSASASIPPAAVIGKVRRGDSGTQPSQGESGASIEVFHRKGGNNVATRLVQVEDFYFTSVECRYVCVCIHWLCSSIHSECSFLSPSISGLNFYVCLHPSHINNELISLS